MIKQIVIAGTAVLVLGGCSTMRGSAGNVGNTTSQAAGNVVDAPLETLNLKRDAIPADLKGVINPYQGFEGKLSCAQISAELGRMNAFLGPDRDVPVKTDENEVANLAGNAAGWMIPYGGAIKYLSGADAHSKKVAEAVAIGLTRRGYLKGRGQAMGCPYPAAPK